MEKGVSIIICTYNRSELLSSCLDSFIQQSTSLPIHIEFIVVDNNSSDDTEQVVDAYRSKILNLKYIREEKVGLSYARNSGIDEAEYEWVCYVDDDAKVYADFVERMFYVIENFNFDVFGGMFYPWYRTPKPAWLPDDFGQLNLARQTTGPLPYGKTVAGGIAAYKKIKLIEAGKFPVDIGMRGSTVGYGEEDYVIRQMWKNGCIVGFDPFWKMDHLVAEYKYTLKWQLKRSFAKGRDAQIKSGQLSLTKKVKLLTKACLTIPYLFILNLPLFLRPKYYFENYVLDSLRYSLRIFGKIFLH